MGTVDETWSSLCKRITSGETVGGSAILAAARNDALRARSLLEGSISAQPQNLSLQIALAELLAASGDASDAETAFASALRVAPRSCDALSSYGRYLLGAGKTLEAVKVLKRASAVDGKRTDTLIALAEALRRLGRFVEAESTAAKAAQIDPNYVGARVTLGKVLRAAGNIDGALEHLKQALTLDPRHAGAYEELGKICLALHRHDDAIDYFREALRQQPSLATSHIGLGLALRLIGKTKDAALSFQCAVEIDAKLAESYVGLGMIANGEDRLADALQAFDHALRLSPDHVLAKYNRAQTLLRHGRLREGWKDIEARWRTSVFSTKARFPSLPIWSGEPLKGREVLVWGEQGVGDEILCATMIPELLDIQRLVLLECDARLAPLFRRTWPAASIVERASPPAAAARSKRVAAQIPMLSLGPLLRPDWSSFPKRKQTLIADADRAKDLRARLLPSDNAAGTLLVGISWISKNPTVASMKSSQLSDWAPILEQRGVKFVDLQYGDTARERAEASKEVGAEIVHCGDIDATEDLDGLAALITACDLVITVSNTTAHLAGALGVPTWILLPPAPAQIWYWFTDREDSPWYDSVRIFRPDKNHDWNQLIKRAATELRAMISPKGKKRFLWF